MRWIAVVLLASPALCLAGEPKPVALPAPQTEGGTPLMQVLKQRHSTREFSPEKLPPQELSNLLWAAFGATRADGKRTAPSAGDRRETDVYLAMADGLYRYQPQGHSLELVLAEDVRAATGMQPFVREAPLNLVYVADFAKMGNFSADDKLLYSAAGTGFIAENVYLYCASRGLAVVVRGMVDRAALARIMKLRPDQRITLTQTVGLPKAR